MSAFRGAIADLIVTAVAVRNDPDEAYECAEAVLAELPDAGDEELMPALRRLADALLTAPVAGAGVLALTVAALVESGGQPGTALGALLERLEEVLEPAAGFVAACQASLRREATPRSAVERLGEQVARTHPSEAAAWNALEPLGLATLALLTREARSRDRARDRADLLPGLRALRAAHDRAEQILDVLDVLDGEQLVVLIPALGQGYRIEVEGIADVAQLRDLLAAELKGTFDLLTARALRPDGTLSSDPTHRLRPADPLQAIEPIEETRVLLLSPALQSPVGSPRRFEAMPASLRVIHTLTPDQVRTWLARCGE